MIDDGTGLRERIKSELLAVYVHGEQGLKSPIGEIADRIAALSAVAPPPVLEGWVLVPRVDVQHAAETCDSWVAMHREYVRVADIERWEYSPGIEGLAESLRATLASTVAVAPLSDWVLVPREPTERMVVAGFEAASDCEDEQDNDTRNTCRGAALAAAAAYRAMLAASPAAPAQPEMQAAPVAWQPIDSAPLGDFLVCVQGWVTAAYRNHDEPIKSMSLHEPFSIQPTHWQALPPPPTGE